MRSCDGRVKGEGGNNANIVFQSWSQFWNVKWERECKSKPKQ